MIHVTVNGRKTTVSRGATILSAANQLGIDIPTFCHDDRLSCSQRCDEYGECKTCSDCKICSVEVEGLTGLPTACGNECTNGMVIWTESPAAVTARKEILLQKLSRHPMDCMNCGKLGDCKLQRYCEKYGINDPAYYIPYEHLPIDDSNKFYFYDANKCISCGKCAKVCKSLMSVDAIKMAQFGLTARVVPKKGANLAESDCVHCGNCVSYCPVGALMPKAENKFRVWETRKVRTTCPYCGVGCQMDLLVKDGKVVGVQPANGKPNEGLLCVKGKFAFDFINHPKRITEPLVRGSDGVLRPAGWDEALAVAADKIKEIKARHGPDAIMGLSSARVTIEENYLFSKFIRAVVGTNNIDHCARL